MCSDTGPYHAVVREAADTLSKTGLQFTRFAIGLFMDYFGAPHIPSHLRTFVWGVDVNSRRAAIPGSGEDVMTMTYSKDVARFIERLLDDDDWPERSIISGSDVTFKQLLSLAEKHRGKYLGEDEVSNKGVNINAGPGFDVTYDSAEKLARGEATVWSSDSGYGGVDPVTMCAYLGLGVVNGKLLLPKEGRLNDRYPEVKPLTIDQLLAEAWGAK